MIAHGPTDVAPRRAGLEWPFRGTIRRWRAPATGETRVIERMREIKRRRKRREKARKARKRAAIAATAKKPAKR